MVSNRENREGEFRELERVALKFLFGPSSILLPVLQETSEPQLLLWHCQAFGDYHSWGMFASYERRSRSLSRRVRQVTWRRSADAERFQHPLVGVAKGFHTWPTIEVRDHNVSANEVERCLDKLSRVVIPAYPSEKKFGCDGETFGVSYAPYGARFEWWCDGPAEWRPLVEWAVEVRGWLIQACSRAVPQLVREPQISASGTLPLP